MTSGFRSFRTAKFFRQIVGKFFEKIFGLRLTAAIRKSFRKKNPSSWRKKNRVGKLRKSENFGRAEEVLSKLSGAKNMRQINHAGF